MTSAQAFAPPVVATAGAEDQTVPLVVLLHGTGSHCRICHTGRQMVG